MPAPTKIQFLHQASRIVGHGKRLVQLLTGTDNNDLRAVDLRALLSTQA
jgi:hypothetical protein